MTQKLKLLGIDPPDVYQAIQYIPTSKTWEIKNNSIALKIHIFEL